MLAVVVVVVIRWEVCGVGRGGGCWCCCGSFADYVSRVGDQRLLF